MKHLIALAIKFVMIAAVLLIMLTGFFGVSFADTLLISLALTLIAYATGDLLIFRSGGARSEQATRNSIATIADVVVAILVIWLVGEALVGSSTDIITPAIISGLFIGGGEWFFHQYLDSRVFRDRTRTRSAA
ncbi:Kef-type K+ transport system membrane component KefB [Planomicrobium sp. HSC-17F08]|nr:Kef-type K+ transport system membrane component KefB [Planomicrobium sp. HSC-17F08]